MARKPSKLPPPPAGYFERSRRPLQALVFLLPFVLFYEVGLFLINHDIVARQYLGAVFEKIGLGVAGYHLLGPLVLMILFCIHLFQRDPWRVSVKMCGGMWLESVLLALPILLFVFVFFREPAQTLAWQSLQAAEPDATQWPEKLVLSVGAGIYEELLFRLIGIAIIHAICIDLLALPRHYGELLAIGVTAVLFAMYHFTVMPFDVKRFAFFTIAGIYFAAVYIYRGFGLVVGTHAMYDVIVALWEAAS